MSLTATLILFFGALALTLFAGWRGSRPPDPRGRVRMAPWRFIMVLSAAAVMLAAIHLAALAGAPMR